MKVRRRPARTEDGSMLIIALVFITVFAVLITAVLTFADVGLRASRAFAKRGAATYGEDGAVQHAIFRYGQGGACENVDAPRDAAGQPVDGRDYTVSCSGPPPGGDRATKPTNALLSLGDTDGEEGIETTRPMRVLGDIFSNSTVLANASLVVQGAVSATDTCTGPIATDPADDIHCANTNPPAEASRGRDPDYNPASSVVPLHRDVPGCPAAPNWLVTLSPGAYDDAAGLTALTTTCANAVVWFQPGFYYFDFTFRGGTSSWIVNDPTVDVVGGQPKGWSPVAPTRPTAGQLKVPGACMTESDGQGVQGVQLVFGGESHVQIDRGHVEVCATPSRTDQAIALYGMAPTRPFHTLEATAVPTNVGFLEPGNALIIGETTAASATATVTTAAPTAQLVVDGFRPGIPAGSLIDSVDLRVRHREDGDLILAPTVTFPGAAGGSCAAGALPQSPGALAEDRIDLKAACNLTDADQFPDLSVRLDATLQSGATGDETLDGVAVEVVYRVPTVMRATAVAASTGFTTPAEALEIEGGSTPVTADAALSDTGTTSASLTLAGLGDPPIPSGSSIDSARLRVVHRDVGALAQPTITVPFAGGTCTALPLTLSPSAFADDRVDLKACGLNDATDLVGLTAIFDAALVTSPPPGATGLESIDGMWLELVFTPPPRTRQAATVTTSPAGSFSNPSDAKTIGETPTALTADATLDATTLPTASLAFTAFDLPSIPSGSYVDSAIVRFAHQETETTPGDIAVTVTIPEPAGTCTVPITVRPVLGTDGIDLKNLPGCPLTNTELLALLPGLSVSFNATLVSGATGDVSLDGLVLDLAYRPPVTRRWSTASTTTFTNTDNAKVIGETPAPLTSDVALGSPAAVGTVTLGGFDSLPIPAGSSIQAARLKVAHLDDVGIAGLALESSFPGNTCSSQALAPQTTMTTDFVDLSACGLKDASQLSGAGGLTAAYTASLPPPTATTQVPITTGSVANWTNPNSGLAIDGTAASATLTAGLVDSASMVVSGYGSPALPAGSYVDSAILRIHHQDDGGAGPITAHVSFTGSTCGTLTVPARSGALASDTFDLRACGLVDPAVLAGLQVTYAVALASGSTADHLLDGVELDIGYRPPASDHLDGVELELVYSPPAMRPLSGCLTAEPYTSASITQCALVKVTTAQDDTVNKKYARFAVAGTIYVPTAAVHLEMQEVTAQMITRGIIARTILIGISPAATNQRATTGIPPEAVTFTAYGKNNLQPDNASSTAAGSMAAYSPAGAAKAIDGALASAAIDTSAGQTGARLDVDWAGAASPPGSVDSLVLRVAHREDTGAGTGIGSVMVDVRNNGAVCQPSTSLAPHSSTGPVVTDQVVVTISHPVTTEYPSGGCGSDPTTLSVSITVGLVASPPAGTYNAYVDGITLDLLASPLLRAKVIYERGTANVTGWTALP